MTATQQNTFLFPAGKLRPSIFYTDHFRKCSRKKNKKTKLYPKEVFKNIGTCAILFLQFQWKHKTASCLLRLMPLFSYSTRFLSLSDTIIRQLLLQSRSTHPWWQALAPTRSTALRSRGALSSTLLRRSHQTRNGDSSDQVCFFNPFLSTLAESLGPQFPLGGHQRANVLLENLSDLCYQEGFSSFRNLLLETVEVAVWMEKLVKIFRVDHLSGSGVNKVDQLVLFAPFGEVEEKDAIAGKSKDLRWRWMSPRHRHCLHWWCCWQAGRLHEKVTRREMRRNDVSLSTPKSRASLCDSVLSSGRSIKTAKTEAL